MSCHWLEAKQSVLNLKVEKWKDRPCGKVESSGLGQQGLGVCPGSLGLEQIAVLWEGANVHNVTAKKKSSNVVHVPASYLNKELALQE